MSYLREISEHIESTIKRLSNTIINYAVSGVNYFVFETDDAIIIGVVEEVAKRIINFFGGVAVKTIGMNKDEFQRTLRRTIAEDNILAKVEKKEEDHWGGLLTYEKIFNFELRNTFIIVKGVYDEDDLYLPKYLFKMLRVGTMEGKRSGIVIVITPSAMLFPHTILDSPSVKVLKPPLPDAGERLWLIKALLGKSEIIENKTVSEEILTASKGLNYEEVVDAANMSILLQRKVSPTIFRDMKIRKIKYRGISYVEPRYNFSYVGGYDFLKDFVKKRVVAYYKNPVLANKFGLKSPRGMILTGVGGTGKTWFTLALAGELSVPMVRIEVADIVGGEMGEARLKEVLRVLDSLAPVVVFMDEIDQIALKREFTKESSERRGMINTLMEWLGRPSRDVFVIGATNLIKQIDETFLRTGRFDSIVFMPPPDYKARLEILKIHTQKIRKLKDVKFDSQLLDDIAKKTELWVASDLESLVQKAFENAMVDYIEKGTSEITIEHFNKAMKSVEPNLELRKQEIRAGINALKMLPQGAVMKESIEKAEIMINVGKRRRVVGEGVV